MRAETIRMPAFLASALINGDTSGLSDDDMRWLDVAHEYVAPGFVVSCAEETHFSWNGGDLPGFNLGCDVVEYTVLYHE